MTPPPLSELSAEEINARVAEQVMGKCVHAPSTQGNDIDRTVDALMRSHVCVKCKRRVSDIELYEQASFNPAEDLRYAFEVETEIERRGLEQLYAYLLTNLLGFPDEHYLWTYDNLWTILHATPRQRCLAALSVVAARTADAKENA